MLRDLPYVPVAPPSTPLTKNTVTTQVAPVDDEETSPSVSEQEVTPPTGGAPGGRTTPATAKPRRSQARSLIASLNAAADDDEPKGARISAHTRARACAHTSL